MRNLALIRYRVRCRRVFRNLQNKVDFIRPYQAQVNSLVILGTIFGIGFWGHLNHWEFGGHHAADQHISEHGENHSHEDQAHPQDNTTPHHNESAGNSIASERVVPSLTESQRESERFVEAHATLQHDPNYVAELSSRVSGVVNRVFKRVGDRVCKGEVLVLIESPIVGEAKASLLKALVQNDLKTRTLNHLRELGTVVSEKKIQEAEADARQAEIQLFNAQQALITLGLPVDLDEFREKQDEELAAQVLALGVPDSVRSEFQNGSLSANLIPIVAPFDGEVIRSKIVVGEYIQASQPEMMISDRKHFWISLNVRREDSDRVFLGQELTFQADSSDEHLSGRIDWIGTEMDEATRTLEARAEILVDSPEIARHVRSNVLGTCRLDLSRRAKIATESRPEAKH